MGYFFLGLFLGAVVGKVEMISAVAREIDQLAGEYGRMAERIDAAISSVRSPYPTPPARRRERQSP